MNEFIDLVRKIYPCIDDVQAENAKKTLMQFARESNSNGITSLYEGKKYDFLECKPDSYLRQGDIIDKLTFYYIDENGEEQEYTSKAMLISNTCDASRDEYLHFAPLMRIEDIIEAADESKRFNLKKDILNNLIYRFMYIPHPKLEEYVVNFHLITSYPRKLIDKALKDKSKTIEDSLNLIGYYLFLCKLTVYFIRNENNEETKRTNFAI